MWARVLKFEYLVSSILLANASSLTLLSPLLLDDVQAQIKEWNLKDSDVQWSEVQVPVAVHGTTASPIDDDEQQAVKNRKLLINRRGGVLKPEYRTLSDQDMEDLSNCPYFYKKCTLPNGARMDMQTFQAARASDTSIPHSIRSEHHPSAPAPKSKQPKPEKQSKRLAILSTESTQTDDGDCGGNAVRNLRGFNKSNIFIRSPSVASPTPGKLWGSCAFVGNSGMLQKRAFGREIDMHDVVMRSKHAPTASYESLVGRKTTHRIMNDVFSKRYSLSKQDIKNGQGNARDAELGPLLPREPGLTLILRPHGGQEALQHMLDVTSKEHPTLRVKKLSQKYITVVHDVLKSFRACHLNNNRRSYPGGGAPSTGILGVTLLMTWCNKTSVFGMGGGKHPDNFPYHYYKWRGTERMEGNDSHSFDAEGALIQALAVSKKITLCNILGCYGQKSVSADKQPLIPNNKPKVNHRTHGSQFVSEN